MDRHMRQCLFCDRPATSREHVWPDWVLEFLASTRTMNVDGELGDGRSFHVGGGRKAELKARCVCDDCNRGWMSKLESTARPILGPLMADIGYSLTPRQQFTVALWAVKTSMVMEAVKIQGRNSFYTQQERQRLGASLLPPQLTQVWIGRYLGGQQLAHWGSDVWDGNPKTGIASVHSYVNTLAIGRLVIQVLSVRFLSGDCHRPVVIHPKKAPWGKLLLSLLPPGKDISWPPPITVDDTTRFDFEFLHNRWKNPPSPPLLAEV